ncbi:UTP--glucose-1-phosphate uridylyltransferase, partial [bacterium]|nr:UTP--glucose-1-phosphate uridylyltransferase [bacterium]
TSMGLRGPKSLVPLRGGYTFLDILVHQILHYREDWHVRCPLILMNSFHTTENTRFHLSRYPKLAAQCVPLELLQSRVPKVMADDYSAAVWRDNPELEWCPPGHGDVYFSLYHTGILKSLIDAGFQYIFLSNIDNLGAVVDERILQYMHSNDIDFLMEVAVRCAMDRKGGHLARYNDGKLVLRESAMCPPDEIEEFQNIEHYGYFNTNSLWVSISALCRLLELHGGLFELPLIVNRKTIDPRNTNSPKVVQLETAMGAAISLFPHAQAIVVPRQRFAPVKTVADLIALRSDAYELSEDYQIRLVPSRKMPPVVEVGSDVRFVGDIERIMPYGVPSLRECNRLRLSGPVSFGRNVRCVGDVSIATDTFYEIPVGAVLGDSAERAG